MNKFDWLTRILLIVGLIGAIILSIYFYDFASMRIDMEPGTSNYYHFLDKAPNEEIGIREVKLERLSSIIIFTLGYCVLFNIIGGIISFVKNKKLLNKYLIILSSIYFLLIIIVCIIGLITVQITY